MKIRTATGGPAFRTTLFLVLALAACSSPGPGVARGEALWDGCAPCHGAQGEGDLTLGAPAIAGLPQWYVFEQLESYERGWRGSHPMDSVGIKMKSMARSLDLGGDMESVSEFVASLPPVDPEPTLEGGDPVAGEAVYNQACVSCHQPDGQGFEGIHAPPLIGQHDWYLLTQYGKFRKGWRGDSPEDIWGRTMAANAEQTDERVVVDILAYLASLR